MLRAIGNLSPPGVPGYASGEFVNNYGNATNSQAVAINTLYACPIPIYAPVTVSGLAISVGTLSAGNAKLGIYTSTGPRTPGSLVAEINADLSTGTTGIKSGAFAANPVLAPGWYWLASCFSATPSVLTVNTANPTAFSFWVAAVGSDSFANAFGGSFPTLTRTASLTYVNATPFFPASFGATTFSASPGSPIVAWSVG